MEWANKAQCAMTRSKMDVGENLFTMQGTGATLEAAAKVYML